MSEDISRHARLIGLVSGVVAIAGIGVLLLSHFGLSFTRLQQLSLLLAAAVLWLVHMPPRLDGRYWRRRLAEARKRTQPFKPRKS